MWEYFYEYLLWKSSLKYKGLFIWWTGCLGCNFKSHPITNIKWTWMKTSLSVSDEGFANLPWFGFSSLVHLDTRKIKEKQRKSIKNGIFRKFEISSILLCINPKNQGKLNFSLISLDITRKNLMIFAPWSRNNVKIDECLLGSNRQWLPDICNFKPSHFRTIQDTLQHRPVPEQVLSSYQNNFLILRLSSYW